MKRLLSLMLFLSALPAFAAGGTCPAGNTTIDVNGNPVSLSSLGITSCFYISKSTGSDTNAGTTEGSPWAHMPGMASATGTAAGTTPTAGEGFIFRGGETWTSGDLGLSLINSGSSGHPIYIGIDPTWFNSSTCAGAVWCRPIFNAGLTTLSPVSNIFQLVNQSWWVIDNIEITGMRNNENGVLNSGGSNIRATRLYFHGWGHTGTSNNVGMFSQCGAGSNIDHNIIDGSDSTKNTFNGVFSSCAGTIAYNYFSFLVSGILATTDIVHDNIFLNTVTSADGDHCNALFTFAPASGNGQLIYNNYINNGNACSGAVVLWFNGNGSTLPTSVNYGFNNVMWGLSSNPVNIGNHGAGNYGTYNWFNNTVDCSLGGCGGPPPSGPFWTINEGNNHYIPSALNFACSGCTVNSLGPDLVQTEAVANGQGYTSTETFPYSPINSCTTATCSTVQAGTNRQAVCSTLAGINAAAGTACQSGTSVACSYNTSGHTLSCPSLTLNARPATVAWDIGAYQLAPAPTFTTWYVRPDGGTRWDPTHTTGQCSGKVDAAYPGSGTNQPCAFNDPRWLWDNQNFGNYPNWIISGGDTVILRANTGGAAWRVGFQGDGSSTDPWCFGGNGAINCIMPSIPSGTAANHTRFLGENYATTANPSSCSTTRTIMTVNGPRVQQIPNVAKTTKIWGGHGEFVVVNLGGSQYVDVQCLDISSFNPACQLQGSPQTNPCNRSVPVSDYSSDGMEMSNTSGPLLLQDLYVHGMNSRGIHGQQGPGAYTVNRVWISIIPQTGFDFDDSTASGTGAFSLTNSIIEASGCQQLLSPPNYPPLSDAQLMNDIGVCYSQGSGNVIGDGIGTPGASGFPVNMDSDVFQWNTQDGEDFGHMDTGSWPFTLTNSVSQHNLGQTFKNGWAFSPVTYINNIAMADCQRFASGFALPGNPPALVNQYNVDPCRAGDNFSINFQANTQMTIANNTIVGYAPTFFDYKCVNNNTNCPGAVWNLNNNIMLAYVNPQWNAAQAPADFCGPGADASSSCNGAIGLVGTINRQNNIYFNVRNCHANQQTPGSINFTSTGEQCTDPLLVNEPPSPMTAFNVLDNFNYNLLSTSPAIKGGVGYSGAPTVDFAELAQTTPLTIGALIQSGTTPPPTVTSIAVTPNPGAVLVGSTLQMICTATYSNFTTSACPSPAWVDTNNFSTISSTGLVTGVSAGSDTITATSSGFSNNATVNVSALPIVANPTASPTPSNYATAQTVTLSDATAGATICYRTDGPNPTAPTPGTCGAGSLTYSTPLTVSTTTTILAIGTLSGSTNSGVASFTYTIAAPPVYQINGTFTINGTYTTLPH